MANKPRWIRSPSVDSPAMLSAVMEFRQKNREVWNRLGLEGELTIVNHLESSTMGDKFLQDVDCPGTLEGWCARCAQGRSGYTFRWSSPLWADAYDRIRRPDSWGHGDPEGIIEATPYDPMFTGNLIDCKGVLLAPRRAACSKECLPMT